MQPPKQLIELRPPEREGGNRELIAALARIIVRTCCAGCEPAHPAHHERKTSDNRVQYAEDESCTRDLRKSA
jgi:hypothetical protein